MNDITAAPAAPESVVTPPTIPTTVDHGVNASQAARELASRRWSRRNETQEPLSAPVEAAAPEPIPPQEEVAAPEEVPGETQATEPAEELPPIEPPRSWTKEEKERFAGYPRELQAYLSEREQQRDRDLRQRQNEAAEREKALKAEHDAAAKARQEYEAALTQAVQIAQQQAAGEFADIKTWDDVQRLTSEDPVRYLKWQAHQQKMQALQGEAKAAQERQMQEQFQKWQTFAAEQDKLFADKVPEINDPEKGPKLRSSAVTALRDTGFTEQELAALWEGRSAITLRDHRLQQLILDAVKYRDAKASAAKPQPAKPVPPVQRPGAAAPRTGALDAELKTLDQKLEQTGSLKDAAALLSARRAARR